MYEKSCASSNHIKSWKDIDFGTAEYEVKKLQMRIAKAVKENRVGKIKSLQWTLTHSFYAKAIAVKRVTENKGKRTPGVDGVCWISNEDKFNAIFTLQRRGYQPQPLRRIYIPKKNGKKRPLSIPTMKDRAMQTLHKMALEPVTGRRHFIRIQTQQMCSRRYRAMFCRLGSKNSTRMGVGR